MPYKKRQHGPPLLTLSIGIFCLYLLAQLRIEYNIIKTEFNSLDAFKKATTTTCSHGLSILSLGLINIGTKLSRLQQELEKQSIKKSTSLSLEQISEEPLKEIPEVTLPKPEALHAIPSNNLEKETIKELSNTTDTASVIKTPSIETINTLEAQLNAAEKYILREEAYSYSDHTINALSEELKSLKSYAHYVETEYAYPDKQEKFEKKLLTLVNKSEQLLTAISEELTGEEKPFQPSLSVAQGLECNKNILKQLQTQLS